MIFDFISAPAQAPTARAPEAPTTQVPTPASAISPAQSSAQPSTSSEFL